MEETQVIPVSIEEEMRGSYLDYAMSVIVGRAIPDIRDGLKPVHRRILYAMLGEGLTSNKKFSKCAGVVGEVLKRLHPHGDSAVYDALVRMAQNWSLRYPLIEGQGNFGSVDGDPAAAYRYTECRMRAIAEAILADIDKDTVDFIANFDDSSEEPVVLPTRVPNLLINGAEGIAVGMTSKIPPHNISEIIKASIKLIESPEVTPEELIEIVPGPDFPTGGIIYGNAPIRQLYRTGKGVIQIRGKVHEEELTSGKKQVDAIIFDELPYQVNKAKLIEKIAELVQSKRVEGISKLRDESDRRGLRVVVELRRDASYEVVLNQLYNFTPLQKSFAVNMLSIVDGRPQVLGLKGMLENFIEHRREVIVRRTRFELKKAKARLHVLEGLLIALENIDEIVKLIKSSESTPIAKTALQEKFELSEIQAQQILDMPLRRLTGLERKAIENEHKEILELVKSLEKILSSSQEVDNVAVEELKEVGEQFNDPRRTEIEENGEEIDLEDMIVEEDMVVTISHKGYAKRLSPSNYRAQNRGGKGVQGTKKLSEGNEDFISDVFIASTHAYLLIFTSTGRLHWLKVHKLPETSRTARGRALVNMVNLTANERITSILPVREFEEGKVVTMLTRLGLIKRVDLMAFSNVRNAGIRAAVIEEGDELIGARLTDGNADCIISTKSGMAIRFHEEGVRLTGRVAKGVRGINLKKDDEVVNIVTVNTEEKKEDITLFTVSENGYGKRTLISEYRTQSRAGKGLIDIKTTERNGNVIGTCLVTDEDDAMLITTGGKVIRMNADTVSVIGRNTQGVRLVKTSEGEQVAAIARLADKNNGEDDNGENISDEEEQS